MVWVSLNYDVSLAELSRNAPSTECGRWISVLAGDDARLVRLVCLPVAAARLQRAGGWATSSLREQK